jgi:hypothetical protein
LKEEIKAMLEEYGISMYTNANPDGNLTVSHYMTLLQKLTSTINHDLMVIYFRVPDNYDFNLDEQHTKRQGSQKGYKESLLQEYQGGTRLHGIIAQEAYQMIKKDIPDIFKYINASNGGYNPIESVLVDSKDKGHKVLHVTDKDVTKQAKLKEVRQRGKTQRATLTKKQIGDKVWKYRYLPPSLDSNFFERNVDADEVTKFRPLTRVY